MAMIGYENTTCKQAAIANANAVYATYMAIGFEMNIIADFDSGFIALSFEFREGSKFQSGSGHEIIANPDIS